MFVNCKTIAIMSGKGGVGKTNFTVNLAVCLAQLLKKVVVIDADFGLGNVDVLLGLKCKYNLKHVLDGQKNLKDVLVTGPLGIKILPAASGIKELANLNEMFIDNLSENFSLLTDKADFILMDAGAGIGNNVRQCARLSDEVIVMTTPEATAITDAYALIKVLAQEKIAKKINLVVNMVENQAQAKAVFDKIKTVLNRFLNIKINFLGSVKKDGKVENAVKYQKAFVSEFPESAASLGIKDVMLRMSAEISCFLK